MLNSFNCQCNMSVKFSRQLLNKKYNENWTFDKDSSASAIHVRQKSSQSRAWEQVMETAVSLLMVQSFEPHNLQSYPWVPSRDITHLRLCEWHYYYDYYMTRKQLSQWHTNSTKWSQTISLICVYIIIITYLK